MVVPWPFAPWSIWLRTQFRDACVRLERKGLPQAKVAKRFTQSQFVFGQVEVLSLAPYDDLHKTLTIFSDYAPERPCSVYFFSLPANRK